MTCETTVAAGAGGAALFTLDPSSLAQLSSGGLTNYRAAGGPVSRLSLETVANRGPSIKYTRGADTNVTEIFMFAQAIAWPSTRRDFRIEIEVLDNAIYPPDAFFGAFFLADATTPLHGFGHVTSTGTKETSFLLNNGVVEKPGVNGTSGGRVFHIDVRGDKPVGAAPRITSVIEGWNPGGGGRAIRRSGPDTTSRGGVDPFGTALSAMGSTWNAPELTRFGFCVHSIGGDLAPATVNILGYRVYLR